MGVAWDSLILIYCGIGTTGIGNIFRISTNVKDYVGATYNAIVLSRCSIETGIRGLSRIIIVLVLIGCGGVSMCR